jgi:hypothetical protein
LTYVLHLKVGEEMVLSSGDGTALRLLVVGALADSVLQGELIMSEENFIRNFPKEDGFRFFLIDVPRGKEGVVGTFLEDRLSDYGSMLRKPLPSWLPFIASKTPIFRPFRRSEVSVCCWAPLGWQPY